MYKSLVKRATPELRTFDKQVAWYHMADGNNGSSWLVNQKGVSIWRDSSECIGSNSNNSN